MSEKKGVKDAYSIKTPEDSITYIEVGRRHTIVILLNKMTTALL